MELWLLEHGHWLLFGFFLLAFGGLLLMQHILNHAPEYTARAVVDSHQTAPGRFHSRWSSGWNYYVTFRLTDGDTVTLYTTEQEFCALKDGMEVTIVWQNENLLRYEE